MTTTTLVPSSLSTYNQRGSWTYSGAASLTAAVADSSDTSYIRTSAPWPGTGGAAISFRMSNFTLPAGARIRGMQGILRCARSAAPNRSIKWHISNGDSKQIKWTRTGMKVMAGAFGSGSIANGYGPFETRVDTGEITQQVINDLNFVIYGAFTTDIYIYKVQIDLKYDTPPTLTLIGPTGLIEDTTAPVFSWDYDDDLEPQHAYEIQVFRGDEVIYGSHTNTSESFHQANRSFPAGDYTYRVRVAQRWTGCGGTFWSSWQNGSFTVAALPNATPQVIASPFSGFLRVEVQHNINLLSYAEQSFELMTSEWADTTGISGQAVDSEEAYQFGDSSMKFTLSASTAELQRHGFYIPALPGLRYRASCYFRKYLGATSADCSVRIKFFSRLGILLQSTIGSTVAEPEIYSYTLPNEGWGLAYHEAVAPEGASFVQMTLNLANATTGQDHYVDNIGLWMVDPAFDTPPTGFRGGTLYGQHQISERFATLEFPTQGRNLLTRAEATMETQSRWTGVGANSVVDDWPGSTKRFGAAALRLTRSGSTGLVQATISDTDTQRFKVNPGEYYAVYASILRSGKFVVHHEDDDGNLIGTSYLEATDTFPIWQDLDTPIGSYTVNLLSGGGTVIRVPDGVSYFTLWCEATAGVGEYHYFDRMAIYKLNDERPLKVGWQEGVPIGRTGLAYVTVEYYDPSEIDAEWHELATKEIDPLSPTVLFEDWDAASGKERRYRARVFREYDAITYISATSEESSAVLQLKNIWISGTGGENGYNFRFDGLPRTEAPDSMATSNYYSGRQWPQIEIGEQRALIITVQFLLSSTADGEAWDRLVEMNKIIIFRDQRGRSYRGLITNVQGVDEQWGSDGRTISFDLLVGGDQSIRDRR